MPLSANPNHTAPGTLPDGWETRSLFSALRIANGQVDPKVEPYRSMTLVAPDHIESGTGRLLQTQTALEQSAISGKYLFDCGDIVYSKIRPYLRKAILASFRGLCSADMYPLTPLDGVSGKYMLAVILGHNFSEYAESVSARSGMPKINRAELAAYSFSLPPAPEQRAIAAVVSDVDALLDGLTRLIAKKRDLKQAAVQQLLTGRTRLPGFRSEWRVRRLGDHATFLKSGAYARAELSAAGGVKYLHYGDIHVASDVRLDARAAAMPFLDESRAHRLDGLIGGDVVFVDASEDTTGVGKSVEIVRADGVRLVAGLHTIAVRFDPTVLADGFKAYLQCCPLFMVQLRRLAAGTKVYATTRGHIASVEMPLPDIQEQTAIATVLSEMDAELAALESRRAKTQALKEAMMQSLLTGRIRLLTPEPAHA